MDFIGYSEQCPKEVYHNDVQTSGKFEITQNECSHKKITEYCVLNRMIDFVSGKPVNLGEWYNMKAGENVHRHHIDKHRQEPPDFAFF